MVIIHPLLVPFITTNYSFHQRQYVMLQFISIHIENKEGLKHYTFYFEGMMKCT